MATKKEQPIILITNDDGITAPGIKNLIEAARTLGKVVVVAPDKAQSGMGWSCCWGLRLIFWMVKETSIWTRII